MNAHDFTDGQVERSIKGAGKAMASNYRKTHAHYGLPAPGFRLTTCADDPKGLYYLREVQEDGTDTPVAVILDNERGALVGPAIANAVNSHAVLLEACKAVLRGFELAPLPGTETDVELLKAAVSKAEGRAS